MNHSQLDQSQPSPNRNTTVDRRVAKKPRGRASPTPPSRSPTASMQFRTGERLAACRTYSIHARHTLDRLDKSATNFDLSQASRLSDLPAGPGLTIPTKAFPSAQLDASCLSQSDFGRGTTLLCSGYEADMRITAFANQRRILPPPDSLRVKLSKKTRSSATSRHRLVFPSTGQIGVDEVAKHSRLPAKVYSRFA